MSWAGIETSYPEKEWSKEKIITKITIVGIHLIFHPKTPKNEYFFFK